MLAPDCLGCERRVPGVGVLGVLDNKGPAISLRGITAACEHDLSVESLQKLQDNQDYRLKKHFSSIKAGPIIF